MRRAFAILIVLAAVGAPLAAQPQRSNPAQAQQATREEPGAPVREEVAGPAEEKTSQTSHAIRLDGKDIKYTATAGTLPLFDQNGERSFFALITFGLSGMAFAFHSGGVAECTGCHALHEAVSASKLLVQSDASSTCISCHGASGASGYHIATPEVDMPLGTPPGNRTPGGDFSCDGSHSAPLGGEAE